MEQKERKFFVVFLILVLGFLVIFFLWVTVQQELNQVREDFKYLRDFSSEQEMQLSALKQFLSNGELFWLQGFDSGEKTFVLVDNRVVMEKGFVEPQGFSSCFVFDGESNQFSNKCVSMVSQQLLCEAVGGKTV